jgi:hypothetical protein
VRARGFASEAGAETFALLTNIFVMKCALLSKVKAPVTGFTAVLKTHVPGPIVVSPSVAAAVVPATADIRWILPNGVTQEGAVSVESLRAEQ